MPQKQLLEIEQNITRQLRRNTLIAGFCSLTAFTLLIPAFSIQGSKFDYQEFCYRPPTTKENPFCKGDRIKKGIAWRVILERGNNQEFKEKVTLLDYLPAQNPNAGIYGFVGAAFFGAAFLCLRKGTGQLEDNLDVVVANKKALITERTLEQIKHLNIQGLKVQQEEEFVRDLMQREHGEVMYSMMSDSEKELAAASYRKGEQLKDAEIELQLIAMKAQAAEQEEKATKHRVEVAKLNKSDSRKKDSGGAVDASEAVREELIAKLKDHEEGWLYTVVMSNKPIFIIGSQGSWKSYCSAAIALARHYLKGQKLVSITDPHFSKNAHEAWKELIQLEPNCYGGAQDWAEVADGILTGFDRWNTRTLKDEPLTSIWDEQTNWALHEECAKYSNDFIGRVISDPRKANEAPVIITHSFTNAGTGGGGGFAQARKEGALQIWLNSDNEMRPLFKGKLLGFKNSDGELVDEMRITIPKDWFNPEAIRKMFSSQK